MNFKGRVCGIGILIGGIASALTGYSQSFLTNGLTAYYPFSGNAHDASGNGLDGVVVGATLTTDRFGAPQQAYRFNGSSWIQIPDAVTAVQPPEMTMTAWVLADSGPYNTTEAITHLTSRRAECGLGINPGKIAAGFNLQSSGWPLLETPLATNQWVQLVGIYKKGQYVQFFVNGQLAASVAIGNENLVGQSSFPLNSAIGIYDYTGGPYQGFKGAIDEVRFYNRALSALEVQGLYQYESGITCIPSRATATATVVNGFVVGATMTSEGCGYTSTRLVLIQGGGGTGATATATINNGMVTDITITDAGVGYTNLPTIYIYSPLGLQTSLLKAVQPHFTDLLIGSNYQLQVSADMSTWTNQGPPFTATSPSMSYTQYWNVDNWNSLFFRLRPSP